MTDEQLAAMHRLLGGADAPPITLAEMRSDRLRAILDGQRARNNGPSNWLADDEKLRRTSMLYFRERARVFWGLPFLVVLSGCGAKPECDSFETRNAVLQTISDDHNNALIKYAAKNSNMSKSSDASSEAEKSKEQPLYLLGEKIDTTSVSEDKRTLKCSGSLSVTVGDTKASKEVNFTVQQSSDGKITVSVAPFQF